MSMWNCPIHGFTTVECCSKASRVTSNGSLSVTDALVPAPTPDAVDIATRAKNLAGGLRANGEVMLGDGWEWGDVACQRDAATLLTELGREVVALRAAPPAAAPVVMLDDPNSVVEVPCSCGAVHRVGFRAAAPVTLSEEEFCALYRAHFATKQDDETILEAERSLLAFVRAALVAAHA